MSISSTPPLGEFELVVLLAVLHVVEGGGLAYGSPVRNEIERRGERTVSRGAVYVTLDRLEDKGLLTSRLTRGSAVREAKPKSASHGTAPRPQTAQQYP